MHGVIDICLVGLCTVVVVLLGYWALIGMVGWWRTWRWRRSLGHPRDAHVVRRNSD